MFERIKFKIDEVGAKVENEAEIMDMLCDFGEEDNRKLIFDEPFWIVMKQKGHFPYLIAQIKNTNFMQTATFS